MANNKWTKQFILRSPEEFELFIIEHNSKFFNINLENLEIVKSISTKLSDMLLTITPFGVNQIRKAFTEINRQINIKSSSDLHVSYYMVRGYSLEYANLAISNIQKKRSKRCPEYWIAKGYTYNDAIEKVSDIQRISACKLSDKIKSDEDFKRKFSIWSIDHWTAKGYTEDEAKEKIKHYNPSCKEFYETTEAWNIGRQTISKRVKKLWQDGVYDDKVKMIQTRYTSKQEKVFFELLLTYIPGVIYEPFGVNIRNYSEDFYYVFDAYYKSDSGIILLEYDGSYWHDIEKDLKRDRLVLDIRSDIIGVIRTNDYFFYKNKINIKTYTDAIRKIESKESDRILLYESA